MRPTIHVLRMPRLSAQRMLHIDEALLRHDPLKRNFLFFNRPLPRHREIILGVSGKPRELVHTAHTEADNIPLVKRFTGGGTVYVDDNVKFVSLIMNKADLPDVKPYPHDIMKFTETFYKPAFEQLSELAASPDAAEVLRSFALVENDYCLGAKKIGGNAQSIIRDRWVHHTSFLWRLAGAPMSRYLTIPSKRPNYRGERSHSDFLCSLTPLLAPAAFDPHADAAPLPPAPEPFPSAEAALAALSTRAATGPAACVFEDCIVDEIKKVFNVVVLPFEEAEAIAAAVGVDKLGTRILMPADYALPPPQPQQQAEINVVN